MDLHARQSFDMDGSFGKVQCSVVWELMPKGHYIHACRYASLSSVDKLLQAQRCHNKYEPSLNEREEVPYNTLWSHRRSELKWSFQHRQLSRQEFLYDAWKSRPYKSSDRDKPLFLLSTIEHGVSSHCLPGRHNHEILTWHSDQLNPVLKISKFAVIASAGASMSVTINLQ